jgi:hypothetical protein
VLGQLAFGVLLQDGGFTHEHDAAAKALCGATSDAITGTATIEARPIFLMTSRRDVPSKLDGTAFSSRLFSLNWSIASHTKSSVTLPPAWLSTSFAISDTELLPSHDLQIIAAD